MKYWPLLESGSLKINPDPKYCQKTRGSSALSHRPGSEVFIDQEVGAKRGNITSCSKKNSFI